MLSAKPKLFNPSYIAGVQGVIDRCPLCLGRNADVMVLRNAGYPSYMGWCPACTNLRISQPPIDTIRTQGKAHLLSAALRRLPASEWNSVVGQSIETNEQVETLISTVAQPSAVEQFDRLLVRLCETSRMACPIFCAVGRVSVAQLFLSSSSRRRGCGEVGSA